MVIVDQGFIALKFKEAMVTLGFTSIEIFIEDADPQTKVIRYMGDPVLVLKCQISMVEEVMPVVYVTTKAWSIDTVAIAERVDEIMKGNIKIFVN